MKTMKAKYPRESEEHSLYIRLMKSEHGLEVLSFRNEAKQNWSKHIASGQLTPGILDTALLRLAWRPEPPAEIWAHGFMGSDPAIMDRYTGLWLEMKRLRGYYGKTDRAWSSDDTIRPAQKDMIRNLRGRGFFAAVAFGHKEALHIATEYLLGGLAHPEGFYFPESFFTTP
jgi:hypothetical protein